jgi:hypothetical protein
VTAFARLAQRRRATGSPLTVLAASGQLGYGIPEKALRAGLARRPDFIGCDMGSIDPGPFYLGSGMPAASDQVTRRDLTLVLKGALELGVPLVIGTAGTAGAAPHLAHTARLIEEVARAERLRFRLATIAADMPRDALKAAIRERRVRPLGPMAALDEGTVDRASHVVGQMGLDAIVQAFAREPDVILAGRACDTAIFTAIPHWLGYPMGPVMHMAKIIECTSICCVPGGRDAMLAILEGDSFILESMAPERAATPLSVAAHSLYEQADPLRVHEPEGTLDVGTARFEAVDPRRTRVGGAVWTPATQRTIKIEGAEWCGERAVLCAGTCDPRVIANVEAIIAGVRANVADIVPPGTNAGYELIFHTYGLGAVSLFPGGAPERPPEELFFLVECIAPTADLAKAVVGVTKQFLLHHGFPGRLSTGGNIAFPFTPPELAGGSAYRFSIHHLMEAADSTAFFPVEIREVGG